MKVNRTQIKQLVTDLGSPLYLYDKQQLLTNIATMKSISSVANLQINYATKANSNINLLKIIKDQGMKVDSTGFGEFYINQQAGFDNQDIYVVANNLTTDELAELASQDLVISVDSFDQLVLLNQVAPGYQKVMIRINPSFGAGENDSIITGGANHKFGIDVEDLPYCVDYIELNNMQLIGVNQHIGSLNLNYKSIIQAVEELISIINQHNLDNLQIINFGGGFGIDYDHSRNLSLDFKQLKIELDQIFTEFLNTYPNPKVSLEFEPGRYIVANTSVLVGTVTSVKKRGKDIYIGTDLGFSQMVRPTMYNSHHHIEFLTDNQLVRDCHVVGNMCESGDYLCKNRRLIVPEVGELVIVHDTGAYGYSMASNFNNRLRPAEVLIDQDTPTIIRKREQLADLLKNY